MCHFYFAVIYCPVLVQFASVSDMTQRQLDVSHFRVNYDEFQRVEFSNNQVTCELNDRFSIVVKRQRHSVEIFLKSGNRRLKLPFNIFDALCNSQVTVTFLKQILEEWRMSDR